MTGLVAVYVERVDTLLPLVENFAQRIHGVIATPADSFSQRRLGPLLWHVAVPPAMVPHLCDQLSVTLEAIEQSVVSNELGVELQRLSSRMHYDLTVTRDDYNRVTGKLQQQVRELTQAQAALSDNEARLRQILDQLPQWVYATDAQGRLMLANQAFAYSRGLQACAMADRTEADLDLPDTWVAASHDGNSRVLASNQPITLPEIALTQRDGRQDWFQVTKLPITLGRESAVLTVATDISPRKAYETKILSLNEELEQRVKARTVELETLNKELESFSYSVSHDLRAPLRAITGFSQSLMEDCGERLQADERQLLERVVSNALRMNQLVDDLLALAKAAQATLNIQPIDLAEIAEICWKSMVPPDRVVHFQVDRPLTAQADARLLQVVLDNLLSNAVKFTRHRPDAVIQVGRAEHAGETAYFVRDNGAGFDMQWAGKLFTPFQRLHDEKEFEGTGIGLATVKRVIARHGGRIWAESAPGAGTTFYFTLPAAS
ncbi:ATP-binding protein [Chitinivorax sp. PXF-14]|uniref:sensor histidine kinase n=1 Tax=Chitinivorax sp. PXF-14 TaxID=3230488 RepID=UPI003467B2EB